ncbi:hypothetical protein [Alcaligenes faecalis]|uniref:hypothetical protein n=1 Tax=Alcaligenes faecalis TaxID=511 RepID=UPI0013DE4927|nr:hypothetical protein [Alcaligenes faecalis]
MTKKKSINSCELIVHPAGRNSEDGVIKLPECLADLPIGTVVTLTPAENRSVILRVLETKQSDKDSEHE